MVGFVVLETPIPESKPEVLETLRVALHYAAMAGFSSVEIKLIDHKGGNILISSDR